MSIDEPEVGQSTNLADRRAFLRWASLSPLISVVGLGGCEIANDIGSPQQAAAGRSPHSVFDLEVAAKKELSHDAFEYLAGGADDLRTVAANSSAFQALKIRARRLVDVSALQTETELFGRRMRSPIVLAPVGLQEIFHPEGELATARATSRANHLMIASSVSNASIQEISSASTRPPWFQLYPTPNRVVTQGLLTRADDAGCPVCVLTVDTPVIGNREGHGEMLKGILDSGAMRMGTYEGLRNGEDINDPSMTWDMVEWLRSQTSMKLVLKGIVTREDAELSVNAGVDGVIVSNHGGRQLESNRATIDCLSEVVSGIGGRMPVMIDGGFRRGTDIFKALALGASAVCIGRPYCWGLSAFGEQGVVQALDILHGELVRAMQIAGTPTLESIDKSFVTT